MNLGERLIEFFLTGGVVGLDPARHLEEYRARLRAFKADEALTIVIAEKAPERFLAALAVAWAARARVVLASAQWRMYEWQEVRQQVAADIILGDSFLSARPVPAEAETLRQGPCLAIPTGGTGGHVRFAVHDDATLAAAARGFHEWQHEASLCCWSGLPLYHVSGLMPVVRAALGQGKFIWSGGRAEGLREAFPGMLNVISLVPTQLARAKRESGADDWLRKFSAILVGGDSVSDELRQFSRSARLPLSPSYGMTETAAAVCAVRPADFLSGDDSSGTALPHARVTLFREDPPEAQRLQVESESLFLGYWGTPEIPRHSWPTDDRGFVDEGGRVYVTGRIRPSINTGGEKVDPGEVERALVESGIAKEALIVGIPDTEWGECVTAVYVPGSLKARDQLKARLSSHKIPKHWIAVKRLPLNAHGKLDSAELSRIVSGI